MPPSSACPDEALLHSLLLGQVAETQVADLEQHLLVCSACTIRMRQATADDALVQAFRNVSRSSLGPETEPALALLPWLKKLRPNPATLASGATDIDTPVNSLPSFDFLAPPTEPGTMGSLGPYRILEVIGAGGMGMVFLAEDPRLQRRLALKVVKPELLSRPGQRERFFSEARAAAAVEHDNIVTIYQVDEVQGVPYLAMPLLRGESLEERLQRQPGPMPLKDILRIGRELATGLAAAHERGLVHRDIKPANVWLEERVKILDFGLAAPCATTSNQAETGAIVGTPAYMAPEQARGLALDGRADLFSLGCVLYRMATGKQPFLGADMVTLLLKIATEDPVPPRGINTALPAELDALIRALLAKKPEDRPPSAPAVVGRFRAIEAQVDRGRTRRRRWLVATSLMLLGGLAAWLFLGGSMPPPAEPGEATLQLDEPDQRIILQRGADPILTIDLKEKNRLTLPPGEYKIKPAAPREGRELVPASILVLEKQQRKVDLRLVGEIRKHQSHSQSVLSVAASPELKSLLVVSAGMDRAVGWWNAAADDEPLLVDAHQSQVRRVAFSPDGKWVASGSGGPGSKPDLSIRLWNVATREATLLVDKLPSAVGGLAFAGPDLLVGGADGNLTRYNLHKKHPPSILAGGHQQEILSLAASADGRLALTGGRDHWVLLWEFPQRKGPTRLEGPTDIVTGVALDPAGQRAAAVGYDRALWLWNLPGGPGKTLAQVEQPLLCVAFAPDGKRLLTGGLDGKIRLWDVESGDQLHAFTGHQQQVTAVCFSGDGRRAVSAGKDRTVRLWELPK